jgi:Fuc2NAc and GlcNAc transferase
VALAAASLAGIAALGALGVVPRAAVLALVGGGAMIAGIGWLDDRGHVPARWRFLVHLAAASWALFWAGGLPSLSLGAWRVELGVAGPVLGALGIVWLTNLYNFMDGIDGIAGGEALTTGVAAGILLWMGGVPGLGSASLVVAAASAGFLVWNWAPARIFMGDVGSGYLGYVFAVLALFSERQGRLPLMLWAVLLGVFLFDATVTLVRRVMRGERFFDAHRKHAYQRAVQAGWPHSRTSGAVLAVNVLLALAATVGWREPRLVPAALAAGTALVAAAYLWVERRRPMWE